MLRHCIAFILIAGFVTPVQRTGPIPWLLDPRTEQKSNLAPEDGHAQHLPTPDRETCRPPVYRT